MKANFSREKILSVLCEEIADCLAIDHGEVQPKANFFSELGGESIDLLDVSFRMQKQCGVRAPFQDLLQGLQFDENGGLSKESEEKLYARFPSIDWSTRIGKMMHNDPRSLLTVDLIAELLFLSELSTTIGSTSTSIEFESKI